MDTQRWTQISIMGGLLIALTSCKGNPAIQQQMDEMEKKTALYSSKVNNVESQVRILKMDLDQAKQLIAQMSNTITAQSEALQKLSTPRPTTHATSKKTSTRRPSSKAKHH